MAARPLVSVQKEQRLLPLPKVFLTPIRFDIIQFVHSTMSLNKRQPYAVSRRAGHQTSAESWGTGRAVARIPRVGGGGTHRSGQGAFGNMCRGGRMFAPTKTFRRWNKKVNIKIRKLAIRAALSASAIPALVMARGHNIEDVPEIPLVVPNTIETLEKTKDAVKFLVQMGLGRDLLKSKRTRHIRCGKGKRRNRRYTLRKGPLIIVNKLTSARAFKNLPGVDMINVNHMNLLRLCPGGRVGRMIVWSEDAFKRLHKLYSMEPGHVVDSKRVINSEEVQGVLRKKIRQQKKIKRSVARPILNPAAKLNRKIARKTQKTARVFNKDLKAKFQKVKARIEKKKQTVLKIKGLMNKNGVPVVPKEKVERKKVSKK